MALSQVKSASFLGIQAYPVDVEVDVAAGLPQWNVVGLPDASIKESKERVRAAIKNSGFPFPSDRITVNLAPANIKKEGSAFDLPIALGILAASEVIPQHKLEQYTFLGELALDGDLRSLKGSLVVASGLDPKPPFVLPKANSHEAALEPKAKIFAAQSLKEVVLFLKDEIKLSPIQTHNIENVFKPEKFLFDFAEVQGQLFARRAIEIAVAGGHNLIFVGPPGSGKTMLAKRIPSILPPLSIDESLDITKIYSAAGLLSSKQTIVKTRPFRSPHHSVSPVALAGGGTWPKPGEVSLAHGGVLFLDEFPEFRRDALESLRSPLEDGVIHISRAKMQTVYPARVMLVAAMNPCPCGFLSDPTRSCRCSTTQIQKYQSKVSGPILDRIDLHVEVPAVSYQTLSKSAKAESSEVILQRILECRCRQKERYSDSSFYTNALMRSKDIKRFATPNEEGKKLIEMAMKELNLSARAYYKILKIARTIADINGSESIQARDIAEAIQYRSLDRQWWG